MHAIVRLCTRILAHRVASCLLSFREPSIVICVSFQRANHWTDFLRAAGIYEQGGSLTIANAGLPFGRLPCGGRARHAALYKQGIHDEDKLVTLASPYPQRK